MNLEDRTTLPRFPVTRQTEQQSVAPGPGDPLPSRLSALIRELARAPSGDEDSSWDQTLAPAP